MRLPFLTPSRSYRGLAAAGVLVLGSALAACGSNHDAGGTPEDGSSAGASTSSSASTSPVADWAAPVTTKGKKIATVQLKDGLSVTAYQVATVKATADDVKFADPATIKPGDRAALVNFVVRNDGSPIEIGGWALTADIELDLPDGDKADIVFPDASTLSAHGLNGDPTRDTPETNRKYPLATGQAYNFAAMFAFPKNPAVVLDVNLAVVADGNLAGKFYKGSAKGSLAP